MPAPFALQLLGGFSLREGGDPPRTAGSARLQSLIGYIALSKESVLQRHAVAEALWPEASDLQAQNNLRQLLHHLRQAWPGFDRWLTVDAREFRWHTDQVSVDARDFERAFESARVSWSKSDRTAARAALERAADRYRGPLLPSCSDEWLTPVRERLQNAALQSLETLSRLLEEARDQTAAIERARQLVALDPAREASCLRLLRLYAGAGDLASARQVYEAYTDVVERELGAAPGPEIRDAYTKLNRRAAAPPRRSDALAAPPLVGRADEWAQIVSAWERTRPGSPALVLIAGDAGIGKTRLAEEALTWADARGMATARSRAYEAEGRLAFGPITELLRSSAVRAALASLEPVWRAEVARLLTELLVEDPTLPPPAPLSDYWQRQRFFEALARALTKASSSLVVVIDDLQWSDADTIEWLHYLLRFDAPVRLLLIATLRDEAVGFDDPVGRLRLALKASGQLTELALGPLDATETSRLAASLGGADLGTDDVVRLFRDTEGNPLFVVETMRGGQSSAAAISEVPATGHVLPPRAMAVVMGRLRQLSEDARELAGVAATVGRAFTASLLQQATEFTEARTVRGLEELWQRRIIREAGGEGRGDAYDFSHDKLREVAYTLLSPMQRQRWHRRVAEALETGDQVSLDAAASRIAAHYEQANQPLRALPHYERAANVALRLFAYDEAAVLLRRLIAIVDRDPDPRRRAERELQAHLRLAAAIRVHRGWASPELEPVHARLVALSSEVGTPEQRAAALATSLFFHEVLGNFHYVATALDEMATTLDQTDSPSLRVMGAVARMGHHALRGEFVLSEAMFNRSTSLYDRSQHASHVALTGADFGVLELAWSSHSLWALGHADEAEARVQQALTLARTLVHPFSEALALAYSAMLDQMEGNHDRAALRAADARAVAERHRVVYYEAWANILLAWDAVRRQSTTANVASLRTAIDAFLATGAKARLPYYLGLLADAHARAGEPALALTRLDEALQVAAGGDGWWDAELHRMRGGVLLRLGDPDAARAAYDRSLEVARTQQSPVFERRTLDSLAELADVSRT